uniref:Uncharacterized protein n=1 Tax=Triticum urartu TaxID=4572 RepID=A0A8R7TJ98_TRIUA
MHGSTHLRLINNVFEVQHRHARTTHNLAHCTGAKERVFSPTSYTNWMFCCWKLPMMDRPRDPITVTHSAPDPESSTM